MKRHSVVLYRCFRNFVFPFVYFVKEFEKVLYCYSFVCTAVWGCLYCHTLFYHSFVFCTAVLRKICSVIHFFCTVVWRVCIVIPFIYKTGVWWSFIWSILCFIQEFAWLEIDVQWRAPVWMDSVCVQAVPTMTPHLYVCQPCYLTLL